MLDWNGSWTAPAFVTDPGSPGCEDGHAGYSYSRSKGLFSGVSLDGASITMDDNANQAVYGRPLTGEDILLRDRAQTNEEVRPFIVSLQKYVPPHRH